MEIVFLAEHKAARELGRVAGIATKKVQPPQERVSLGVLRVEVSRGAPQRWFDPEERFLFRITEMVESYVDIEIHLTGREEVRTMYEFCAETAKARKLTLSYSNQTRIPELDFTPPRAA